MIAAALPLSPEGTRHVERTPMQKRGFLGLQNAAVEGAPDHSRPWSQPLRLIVHHVNDKTNEIYIREVR